MCVCGGGGGGENAYPVDKVYHPLTLKVSKHGIKSTEGIGLIKEG